MAKGFKTCSSKMRTAVDLSRWGMPVAGEYGLAYAAFLSVVAGACGKMATGAVPLDAADRRLLRIVQQNSALSAEDLGSKCGMSASTVLRRLKRLRASGVIRAEAAIVDAAKVGRPLMLIIGVRLVREDARMVQKFLDRMQSDPAIMQCYFVTGTSDYILHMCARDMNEYDAFVQKLVSDPHVAMSETHVVIKAVKMSLGVPIDD